MPPAADDFDLILVGGGLAAALIAWRLAIDRPDVRVGVVERDGRLGGVHTWSFFDSDLSEGDLAWIGPAVAHRWPAGYDVFFPQRCRVLKTPYNSVTSDRLHAAVSPYLGDRLVGAEAVSVDPTGVTLSGGRHLAGAVIDCRGPQPTTRLDLAWQVFLGRKLRLARPHGLTRPTVMDATVTQSGGYRFVYLLPFDAMTVLVEDTCYSDSPTLNHPALAAGIEAYVRSRGWTVEAVEGEEQGVLPIALDGDIKGFWADGPPVARAGLLAALFHPVTGYSLPDAVDLARAVAAEPDLTSASLRALTESHSKRLWETRSFYRLLNRMLFRAAEPARRWRVLQRFYGLPEGVVRRFYAGQTTSGDKLRILAGKPPVSIRAALRQLHETGQGPAA